MDNPAFKNSLLLMVLTILASGVGACVTCGTAANDVSEELELHRTEVVNSTSAIDMTATSLEAAYAANEVAADNQYKGKVMRVTGLVGEISKDIFDTPQVILNSSRAIGGVRCSYGKSDVNALAQLSKGQRVTLRGVGNGSMMGSPILQGCSLDDRQPVSPSAAASRFCTIHVGARGITVNGTPTSLSEAVAMCKATIGAEVEIDGSTREGDWADLRNALDTADVTIMLK